MYRGGNTDKHDGKRSNHSSSDDNSFRYHTPEHHGGFHMPTNFIMQGPQGPPGQRGCMGPEGLQGPQGPQGASILTGEGAPTRYQGQDGDTYVDTTTGTVYRKVLGQWVGTTGNMAGPTGPTGPAITGPTGPSGCGVYGRLWIDADRSVLATTNISTSWSLLGGLNWSWDPEMSGTSPATDPTMTNHILQVDVPGVFQIEASFVVNYNGNLQARITQFPPNAGIVGTNTLVNVSNTPTVHLTTIIRVNTAAAFGIGLLGDTNTTVDVNYASLKIVRLGT